MQRRALCWRKKRPTGYDFNVLSTGCAKDLGLPSDTAQAVGQQCARSRQQHKERLLC
jgi:hypothetical protein